MEWAGWTKSARWRAFGGQGYGFGLSHGDDPSEVDVGEFVEREETFLAFAFLFGFSGIGLQVEGSAVRGGDDESFFLDGFDADGLSVDAGHDGVAVSELCASGFGPESLVEHFAVDAGGEGGIADAHGVGEASPVLHSGGIWEFLVSLELGEVCGERFFGIGILDADEFEAGGECFKFGGVVV